MTDALRARFRAQPPEGFVPVQVAMQRLGVSRQTIWNRVRAGALASCHVTHGSQRGLYVEIADEETLPLFEPPSAELQAWPGTMDVPSHNDQSVNCAGAPDAVREAASSPSRTT